MKGWEYMSNLQFWSIHVERSMALPSRDLFLAHLLQVGLDTNLPQNVGLVLNLVLHVKLVRLHLLQQLRNKGSQNADSEQRRIGRVVNGDSSSGYAAL